MTKPLIHICIPFYNSSEFLAEAIDSVINQTYSNWKLLIYNDGSSSSEASKLEEILQAKTDKYEIIGNDKIGVYQARINLLEWPKNGYVMFLDADDYYADEYVLEKIASEINKNHSDIIFFDYFMYIKGSRKVIKLFDSYPSKITSDKLMFTNNILNSLCCKVIDVRLIKQAKFIKGLTFAFAEDRLLSAQLQAEAKTLSYIESPLYCYRDNIKSASNLNFSNSRIYDQINVEKQISKLALVKNFKSYKIEAYISEHVVYPQLWYIVKNLKNKKERISKYYNLTAIMKKKGIKLAPELVQRNYRRAAVGLFRNQKFQVLDRYLIMLKFLKKMLFWKS